MDWHYYFNSCFIERNYIRSWKRYIPEFHHNFRCDISLQDWLHRDQRVFEAEFEILHASISSMQIRKTSRRATHIFRRRRDGPDLLQSLRTCLQLKRHLFNPFFFYIVLDAFLPHHWSTLAGLALQACSVAICSLVTILLISVLKESCALFWSGLREGRSIYRGPLICVVFSSESVCWCCPRHILCPDRTVRRRRRFEVNKGKKGGLHGRCGAPAAAAGRQKKASKTTTPPLRGRRRTSGIMSNTINSSGWTIDFDHEIDRMVHY